MEEEEEECHPLLRGGNRRKDKGGGYTHGFSNNQMHVMASICDALFPSLSFNNETSQQLLSPFYSASGSQYPFPDEVLFLIQLYIYFLILFLYRLNTSIAYPKKKKTFVDLLLLIFRYTEGVLFCN